MPTDDSPRAVPFAVDPTDRIPAERYHDQAFFDLEAEHLWSSVWQMACRLQEIPNAGDFVEYTNLGKSVIVVRDTNGDVNAFHNACRHRGVQLAVDRGCAKNGFVCPFHGWCYGLDGANTFVYSPDHFRDENLVPDELNLRPCRVELWGGSAFINHDDDAPPLRDSLGPFAPAMEAFSVEDMQIEWWESAVLPVNWRLVLGAFLEGYHVRTTHPELSPPGTRDKDTYAPSRPGVDYASRYAGSDDSQTQVDNFLYYIKNLGEGMGGMVHAREIAVAESIRHMDLPDPATASRDFTAALYVALAEWGRESGTPDAGLRRNGGTGRPVRRVLRIPALFLVAGVCQRLGLSGPSDWARRDAVRDLVAGTLCARRAAANSRYAHTNGTRRRTLALDPAPGLFESSPPAEGPARQGVRIHAVG